MNKQKQTEEMSNIIAEVAFVQAHEENGDEYLSDIVAEELYNAGYRKSDEYEADIEYLNRRIAELEQDLVHADENVFFREQNVVLYEEKIKSEARKETAKEILQYLYDKCYEIQNIGRGGIAHVLPIDILQLAKNYVVEVKK